MIYVAFDSWIHTGETANAREYSAAHAIGDKYAQLRIEWKLLLGASGTASDKSGHNGTDRE